MTTAVDDQQMVDYLNAKLADPAYTPEIMPAAEIARALRVTRAAVTNWGARTTRTGVHRYPGGYDRNEVVRWILKRSNDHATRRAGDFRNR